MSRIVYYVFLLILVFLVVSYYKGSTGVISSLSTGATSIIGKLQGSGKYAV